MTIVGDADTMISADEAEAARPFFRRDYRVITLHGGHFVHCQDPRFPTALADAIT